MALKLAFMGTPQFSVPILEALVQHGYPIRAVYTQPPRPAGRRGLALTLSPVHQKAMELGLEVLTPPSLRDEQAQQVFDDFKFDCAIVVAYGLLLPKEILSAPRLGCFNIHASLLPRWRGAAPIQRAIMAGDKKTGLAFMKMDEGLDQGPVGMVESVDISPDMDAGMLEHELSEASKPFIVAAMKALLAGRMTFTDQPQQGQSYAAKISKEETRINWQMPAQHIINHIRGLAPTPGSWCEMVINGKPERVKILAATLAKPERDDLAREQNLMVETEDGAIMLDRLQRAGGKVLNVKDFLRGAVVTKVY